MELPLELKSTFGGIAGRTLKECIEESRRNSWKDSGGTMEEFLEKLWRNSRSNVKEFIKKLWSISRRKTEGMFSELQNNLGRNRGKISGETAKKLLKELSRNEENLRCGVPKKL